MIGRFAWAMFCLGAACLPASRLQAADDPALVLARQGYAFADKYCYRCHGVKFEVENFNILKLDSRLQPGKKYVVPGKPEESKIWIKTGIKKDMPPEGHPQPTAAELDIFQQWVAAGTPDPIFADPPRPFVSDLDILKAIRNDLQAALPQDRESYRYFTFAHLHNNTTVERLGKNGKPIDTQDLRLARAATSKLLNSLSWKPRIVVPQPVDPLQTVLRVDVRDLGWDKLNLWKSIIRGVEETTEVNGKKTTQLIGRYPFGLTYHEHPEAIYRDLQKEISNLSGTDLPYVRGDWFVDTAARPPLYHVLLQLPKQIDELEKTLQVDPIADFNNNKLVRAGFGESGVSKSNRLLDRFDSVHGEYWKSYDFAKSEGKGDLMKFPLGPGFDKNPFAAQAFEHDGGEMIFHLPNGLMGYYLSDAAGKRIDVGPIAIVRDLKETAGTPEVVNGMSCMACHEFGVKRFTDTVRAGNALQGGALLKVQSLYRVQDELTKLLDEDEQRFMVGVEKATAPFFKGPNDAVVSVRDAKEPISRIAGIYQKDLDLEDAAAELGFANPKDFLAAINNNNKLRELTLAPLAQGAMLKRANWASTKGTLSLFHRVALETNRGTPYVEF